MKVTVKKKVVGPQESGYVNVKRVCPYGPYAAGEHRTGHVSVLHNWKGDIDQIGVSVDYKNEEDIGDNDTEWQCVAEITLTRNEAIVLAELLIKGVKDADSLR